ncbi:MAG: glycogen debranching protein [Chitinophagaceae bacterium]|nr:MAG: glycogen debranching protein [Chitinophagaceae bacterium]
MLIWSVSVEAQNNSPAPYSTIQKIFNTGEQIPGKPAYLASPYNTAGDRAYMVGFQDGSFPPLGWHVTGEMGGIWSHPIKLADGFSETIRSDERNIKLVADSFINYPFGNRHVYTNLWEGLKVQRYQFVPDHLSAVYVEYIFTNNSVKKKEFDFDFHFESNLRPVWLGERTGMKDGKDQLRYEQRSGRSVFKDGLNDWFVVVGSDKKGIVLNDQQSKKPNIATSDTRFHLSIAPNTSTNIRIMIAGSMLSEADAVSTWTRLQKNAMVLLAQKKKRFDSIENHSKITLSDKQLEQAFRWVKYNSDWLITDVPGRGRGITAGLPDYPWWFGGDMAYTLKGLIATGQKDAVYASIDLIHRISAETNGNGRVVHEVLTNGSVYNPGNINETAQFASLVWEVFCWTGDTTFLKKYYQAIKQGMDWLLNENDKDKNLLPDGAGMMEIHGLNSEMIDVASYTQRACVDLALMARIFDDTVLAEKYKGIASELSRKINTDFWVEEFGSYADFRATAKQAMKLADDAIVRADTLKKPWAVAELNATRQKMQQYEPDSVRGFVMHHNWVVNTPMEMGIADTARALAALATAQKFTSPFGMFVTGIDRDENAGNDEGSFAAEANKRAFTYTGAVMTLPTGVQVVAENNYGRADQAYSLLRKMVATFGYALPGSIYEVSPDFGMMTQAWNLYAFGEPLIKQTFGIRPMVSERKVYISPLLPSKLDSGSISNVVVGKNSISVSFQQQTKATTYLIRQKLNNYEIVFSQPAGKYNIWLMNGKPVKPMLNGNREEIICRDFELEITLK